jgi:hypothetical protein
MPKRYEVTSAPAATSGKRRVEFHKVADDPKDHTPDPQSVEVPAELCGWTLDELKKKFGIPPTTT